MPSIESRARRRRRRSVIARSLAAVVSVAALVGFAAVAHDSDPKRVITNEPSTSAPAKGVLPTKPTPTSGPVVPTSVLPWINKVVEPNTRDAFAHTLDASGVRGAPKCGLGDLNATLSFGGAGGTMYAGIKVRNVSPNACYVEGSPYVGFLDNAGRTAAAYSPGNRATDARIVLVPGSWARVGLTSVGPDFCEPGNSDPPDSAIVAVAFGIDANETRTVRPLPGSDAVDGCPASVLAGEHTGPFEALNADNGSSLQFEFESPRLTLEAPMSAHRGQVVSFSMTLTNTSSNGFMLEGQNCPLYQMSLGATVSEPLLLNCGGSEGIALLGRGESVRFDMRLTVPSDQPLGETRLQWQFIEPEQPALSASVTVVP
jgi:hypothetical protein